VGEEIRFSLPDAVSTEFVNCDGFPHGFESSAEEMMESLSLTWPDGSHVHVIKERLTSVKSQENENKRAG
jgi:hypothetical protein